MSFDPYHQWLGIPLQEQPPHCYRLLGVQMFEADPSVIDHAADRQMAHLRSFQQGPRGALAAQLMNEVSAARVCLLDQAKKAAYDAFLNAHLAALTPMVAMADPDLPPLAAAEPELPPMAAGEPELPPPVVESSPFHVAAPSHRPQSTRPSATRPQSTHPRATHPHPARPRKEKNVVVEIAKIVIGGAAGILVALLIGGFGFGVGPLGNSKNKPAAGSAAQSKSGSDTKHQVAAKPSDRNPAQLRVQPRSQPATQRFGDKASPVPEINPGSNLDSAESRAALLAKLLDQPFAEVVPSLGGEFVPLQADVPSTTSPRYVWSNVAPQLSGLHFLRNQHPQKTTDFKITNPGMVLLAVYTQWRSGAAGEWQEDVVIQKDLLADGWRAVGNLDSHVKSSLGDIQKFVIFAKDCRKEETFSYRTEQDVAPVLILKPRSSMLAKSDTPNQPSGPATRPVKQAVPNEATAKASRDTIREIFKQEYAAVENAQQTPEQLTEARLKFAKALHEYADSVQDDLAARFVLFSEAFHQAVAAGNVQRSQQLTDQLTAEYEVDEFVWRQDLLTKLAQTVQTDRVKLELAISAISLANQLLEAERFEDALRIADLAQSLGESNARLKTRAQACGNEIRAAQQQSNAIQAAKTTLATNPHDADANLLYGTHLCLKADDWPSGLLLLAKGSDQQLRSIASDDVDEDQNASRENERMVELADKWYELAKTDASYQPFLVRAYYWYSKALPEAKSLVKIKLEKRMEELQEYDPGKSMGLSAADPSGESIAAAIKRLSRTGSSFAKVKLSLAGTFAPLEIDSAITTDARVFHWSDIPQELLVEELGFLRNKQGEATLQFEITSSGIVLMTALWTDTGNVDGPEKETSTQQDLETDGWVPVGKLKSMNRSTGKSEDWVLFARHCKKEDFFSYHTNISTAPVLILK